MLRPSGFLAQGNVCAGDLPQPQFPGQERGIFKGRGLFRCRELRRHSDEANSFPFIYSLGKNVTQKICLKSEGSFTPAVIRDEPHARRN